MIGWQAFGSLELVQGAVVFVLLVVAHRFGKRDGAEEYRQGMAERRSLRRTEARAAAYTGRHQAAPWPGPEANQLATTGELRALEAAAETGDLAEIERTNAAFMRIFDLIAWTRKDRETAA